MILIRVISSQAAACIWLRKVAALSRDSQLWDRAEIETGAAQSIVNLNMIGKHKSPLKAADGTAIEPQYSE